MPRINAPCGSARRPRWASFPCGVQTGRKFRDISTTKPTKASVLGSVLHLRGPLEVKDRAAVPVTPRHFVISRSRSQPRSSLSEAHAGPSRAQAGAALSPLRAGSAHPAAAKGRRSRVAGQMSWPPRGHLRHSPRLVHLQGACGEPSARQDRQAHRGRALRSLSPFLTAFKAASPQPDRQTWAVLPDAQEWALAASCPPRQPLGLLGTRRGRVSPRSSPRSSGVSRAPSLPGLVGEAGAHTVSLRAPLCPSSCVGRRGCL